MPGQKIVHHYRDWLLDTVGENKWWVPQNSHKKLWLMKNNLKSRSLFFTQESVFWLIVRSKQSPQTNTWLQNQTRSQKHLISMSAMQEAVKPSTHLFIYVFFLVCPVKYSADRMTDLQLSFINSFVMSCHFMVPFSPGGLLKTDQLPGKFLVWGKKKKKRPDWSQDGILPTRQLE